MAQIIGYVKSVTGNFVAKSTNGEERILKVGDPVYAYDYVYDPSGSMSDKIVIDLVSSDEDLSFSGTTEIVFDESVVSSDTLVAESLLREADVKSALAKAEVSDADSIDEILKEFGDIDVEETAAGEEKEEGGVVSSAYTDKFAASENAAADVKSSLRNVESHSYALEDGYRQGVGDNLFAASLFSTSTASAAANAAEPATPVSPVTPTNDNTAQTPVQPVQPIIDAVTYNSIDIHDPSGDGVLNAQEASNLSLSGSVEPGSTIDSVRISDGVHTYIVPESKIVYDPQTGNFKIDGVDISDLSDGRLTISVTSSDRFGNSATSTDTIEKDTTPPKISVDAPDNTDDITPLITGRTDAPDGTKVTIEITDADGNVQTVEAVVQDGKFSAEVPEPLPNGAYSVSATVSDSAGNSATAEDTNNIVYLVRAPVVTITEDANNDGYINSSELNGDVDVRIDVSGSSAGDRLVITNPDGTTTDVTITQDMIDSGYTLSYPAPSNGSSIEVSAKIVDSAGNSSASSSDSAVVDTEAPSLTVSAPDITNDNTPTITGTTDAPAGSRVSITVTDSAGNSQSIEAVVQPDGSYSADVTTPLPNGPYSVTAKVSDPAGNEATAADNNNIVDTQAPNVSITSITDDTGTPSDFVTSDNTLVFSGTAEAGSSVEVKLDGDTIGTVTADQNGVWSLDYTSHTLRDGDYTLTAVATDSAGNSAAAQQRVTVDTQAPSAPVVTITEDTDNDGYINAGELNGGIDVKFSVSGDTQVGDTLRITNPDGTATDVTITQDIIDNGYTTAYPSPGEGNTIAVSAVVIDRAGNTSASSSDSAVVDTQAPTLNDHSFSYSENQGADSIVATMPQNGDIVGYRFSNGTQISDDGYFTIDDSGNIRITQAGAAASANDYESAPNIHTY